MLRLLLLLLLLLKMMKMMMKDQKRIDEKNWNLVDLKGKRVMWSYLQ